MSIIESINLAIRKFNLSIGRCRYCGKEAHLKYDSGDILIHRNCCSQDCANKLRDKRWDDRDNERNSILNKPEEK